MLKYQKKCTKNKKNSIIIKSIRENLAAKLKPQDVTYLDALELANSINYVEKNGRNVLLWYIQNCGAKADPQIVNLIIKAGIKLTHSDCNGHTVLHLASIKQCLSTQLF